MRRSIHSVRWILLPTLVSTIALGAPKAKKPPKKTTTPTKTTTPAKTTTPTPTEPTTPNEPADPAKEAKVAPTTLPATPTTPAGGAGVAGGGSGMGGGSATPTEPKADANEPDVDSLRQEYLSLRDELFKSRARANAVASQLYSTRVSIKLTYTTGRYYNPAKAGVRLDGASVFDDSTGAIAKDDGTRFDGYVAPGRHVITFRVEATGKDDDTFTSTTETQIIVKAVAGKDLIVAAKAHDSGDIAYAWKRNERGSYGLGIDVGVKTQPHAQGDTTGKADAKGKTK